MIWGQGAVFCAMVVLVAGVSHAAPQKVAQKKEPIEISAQEALEWRRDDKQYIARTAVIAKQGETEIHADEMVADYRDKNGNAPTIYRLTAKGHVKIISGGTNTITGDQAVYDVDAKNAVMTGQDLKMVNPEQTVTAHERFEYWSDEGRVVAVGDARVVRGTDTIDADQITAWLADDASGKRDMTRAEAVGNVVITTPKEKAVGTRAVYERATDMATLEGPVTITREKNVLTGARAEVNLKTSLSTLYGDENKGGRVKGVFYTGTTAENK